MRKYIMSCDIDKLITYEEPKVQFWDGKSCDAGRKFSLGPGYYNCGYFGCNNNSGLPGDSLDGLWVPPNQYVYLYNDFMRNAAVNGVRDITGETYKEMTRWDEGVDNNTIKPICRGGGVVVNIDSAGYGKTHADNPNAIDTGCGRDNMAGHWGFQNMLGKNSFRFPDPNDTFGDTCRGKKKSVIAQYTCANSAPIIVPDDRPNGVYGPGFYDTLRMEGNFDTEKYLPDPYFRKGSRAEINKVDTTIIRRSRPWEEHIRDCCFGVINNTQLCGAFNTQLRNGRYNEDQGTNCAPIINKYCTTEDIKSGAARADGKDGRCYKMCQKNPSVCDSIKMRFCTENPKDRWCDCINADTRAEYINRKGILDRKGFNIPHKICMLGRCTTGIDGINIFMTGDLQKAVNETSSQCPSPTIYQEVNTSGSNNIIGVDMTAGGSSNTNSDSNETNNVLDNTQPGNTASSNLFSRGYSSWILLVVFLIVLIGGGFLFFGSKKNEASMANKSSTLN